MSVKEEPGNIGKVLSFLRQWDQGDSTVRSRMLSTFLRQNSRKTQFELELKFAQVASLFLARLTTWMKLTLYSYMCGPYLELQLKAIGIFLSASNHDQYLKEFLDDGGILTLLEILSLSQTKEEEKAEALRLLITVSNAGCSYKEFICESCGVKVISECLDMLNTNDTQELAGELLKSLSFGNPKYQEQIYKSLIDLMTYTSPKSQRIVLHTLRSVQRNLKTADHRIVKPLLDTLRSQHLEIHDEAINMILELKHYDIKGLLLSGLVTLLRPNTEEVPTEGDEWIETTGSLSVFVQQAAAAKTIRFPLTEEPLLIFTSERLYLSESLLLTFLSCCQLTMLLSEKDPEISYQLLSLGVIQQLLHAMGNRQHADVQIKASLALEHFVRSFSGIEEHVQRVMGSTMFEAFLNRPDSFYMNMDERQAEVLLSNQVTTSQVLNSIKFVC